MKKFLLLLLLGGIVYSSKAQINLDSLEYRIRPDSLKTGELHLNINNFNFLRNLEYFNKIQDGYTLFGAQLEPQLVYYAHPRLAITAGVHMRKDFGGRGIYRTLPLFSVKYQHGNTTLINGVLEGNVNHRMLEPIFDFEKTITDPVEYGTQFIINNKSLFLDAFINWKKMIYKPSPVQEQILGGLSADLKLIRNEKLSLSLPLQLTVFHQGGQIDVTSEPLQTLVNSAIGFKLKAATSGFVNSFRTENYLITFNDFSFTYVHPYTAGYGLYLNAGADTKYGSLMGTYWNGKTFISSNGMPLYQSVSQHISNAGYTEDKRKLIMLRYSFQKQLLPNLYMDFRLEPFIDLGRPARSRKIEFSNSSYLVYRHSFKLLKTKADK
jgi:hypothetical protein